MVSAANPPPNDPTRGIDVGTKQELYELLSELAQAGAAILFYSTDVDELVGCCDRVLVMVDGAIGASSRGPDPTSTALVSRALDLGTGRCDTERTTCPPTWLRENMGRSLLAPAFVADVRRLMRPTTGRDLTANVAQTAANKA
jgi:energy-coupling factor transporter ATP-binding protein EcfA2